MTNARSTLARTGPLILLAAATAGNAVLPWLLSRSARTAAARDFTDCDEATPRTHR